MQDTTANAVRQLNNGIVIRGQFSRIRGSAQAVQLELCLGHAMAAHLWSETVLVKNCSNPSELLRESILELEQQLIGSCLDQIPASKKGLLVIHHGLKLFFDRRRKLRQAA